MSNFQTIFIAIFVGLAVLGVLIFADVIKIPGSNSKKGLQGNVVIWGTFPSSSFTKIIKGVKLNNKDLNLSYVKKETATYQQDLIEAFANGKGPDLYIITPDMIQENENFIYKIPFASYPKSTFTDSFIDGADIYLDNTGVLGYPLVVDPMVLYYNKDILSNEGIVSPPTNWDELFNLNSILTKRDNEGKIFQSMIALGQYENVNNAKDILATLLIQNGDSIVERRNTSGGSLGYVSNFNNDMLTVLDFFLSFSNMSNSAYSWNRSLPNSLDMFTSSKLAFYIGRASEIFKIESINPNLSFNVAQIPQAKNSPNKRTLGEIYGIVVSKKSPNTTSAISIAQLLSLGVYAQNLSVEVSLPPAGRALLKNKPTDNPYLYLFFDSALISRSWLDPNKNKTDLIFSELIDNILSNRVSAGEAIKRAQDQINLLNIK